MEMPTGDIICKFCLHWSLESFYWSSDCIPWILRNTSEKTLRCEVPSGIVCQMLMTCCRYLSSVVYDFHESFVLLRYELWHWAQTKLWLCVIIKEMNTFDILLTMHLSIFILVINQLDTQNLFYNKFMSCLYIFRAPCAHRQEVKTVLYGIWYHHTL